MTTDNAPVLRSALHRLDPPPPPSKTSDPTTIRLETDQHGTCLFVNIPAHGAFTPAQLIACLEAQQALGQARADAAVLHVSVERLSTERKTAEQNYDALVQRVNAFGSQLQAWDFAAAAQEVYREILGGTVHAPDYNQVLDQLIALKTAPRRQAVALMAVQCTQRRLILHVVTADTALVAFVEAKRIAALDRDGWYVEQFAVEEITNVS